jgi:hypothetical protein
MVQASAPVSTATFLISLMSGSLLLGTGTSLLALVFWRLTLRYMLGKNHEPIRITEYFKENVHERANPADRSR